MHLTTVITWSDSKVLLGAPPLAIAPRMDVPTHLETLSEHRVEAGTVVDVQYAVITIQTRQRRTNQQ